MTPAGELLASEIRRDGPISFRRFMQVALYDPEHGYYRRARDPFGKAGDFFTAEQIQPVFGILMAPLSPVVVASLFVGAIAFAVLLVEVKVVIFRDLNLQA